MANPFNLSGLEFLAFYTLLGVTINVVLRVLLGKYRSEVSRYLLLSSAEPYKIAYLRAGFAESIRVAILSLIDRGLLKSTGDLVESDCSADRFGLKPIERAILDRFKNPGRIAKVFTDPALVWLGKEFQQKLEEMNLLFEKSALARRKGIVASALLALVGISLIKIGLAIHRGHFNILFLIVLTIIFGLWTYRVWPSRRTQSGEATLAALREKFSNLKNDAGRLRPGGTTNEADYLAAVFGVGALSSVYFPYAKELFPNAYRKPNSGSSSGAGCGGAGCGGGCGGGGCGGGCGGCGG